MNKGLMIIGAGVEQVPGIKLARKMGLKVAATDINPQAPGFKYADRHYLVSTYDIEGNIKAAREYARRNKLNGVITLGCDVPLTVACVAKALGLPGHSIETARLACHKLEMKKRFFSENIPVPWFREIKNAGELRQIIKERGCSLVIKPVDSRGARGVLRLNKAIDIEWAFQEAKKNSPSGRVMAEMWLEGRQLSTESVIYNGFAITCGYSDRNYEFLEKYSPYVIENGGQLPSLISDKTKVEVHNLIVKAAKSIGIGQGSVKGDIVVTKDGPKVIELAARLSGGYFCTHEIPLSTGVNIIEAIIKISLGEKPDFNKLAPKYQKGVAIRFLFPSPGIASRVIVAGEIRRQKWVKAMQVYVKPKDVLEEITCHPKRAGFVLCIGNSRQEAVKRAKEAIEKIKIEVGP